MPPSYWETYYTPLGVCWVNYYTPWIHTVYTNIRPCIVRKLLRTLDEFCVNYYTPLYTYFVRYYTPLDAYCAHYYTPLDAHCVNYYTPLGAHCINC